MEGIRSALDTLSNLSYATDANKLQFPAADLENLYAALESAGDHSPEFVLQYVQERLDQLVVGAELSNLHKEIVEWVDDSTRTPTKELFEARRNLLDKVRTVATHYGVRLAQVLPSVGPKLVA